MNGKGTIREIRDITARLDRAKIYYRLAHERYEAITIDVSVPGQRIEIDVLSDGTIEVEIFKSDGTIYDADQIDNIVREFSD